MSPKLAKRCVSLDRIGLDSMRGEEARGGRECGGEVRMQQLAASFYR